MSVFNIINVTEKFTPGDIEGADILFMTGITESTLSDAIILALSAREKGIITAGIPGGDIDSCNEDMKRFADIADAVIFAREKTDDTLRRIAEELSAIRDGDIFDIPKIAAIFRNAGTVYFWTEAANNPRTAAEKVAEMSGDVKGVKGILLNITSSSNINIAELRHATRIFADTCADDAKVLWGHVTDEGMGDNVRVSVFAAMNDSGYTDYTDFITHESPENIAAIIEAGPDERTLLRLGTMEKFFEAAIRLGRAEIIKSLMQHGYEPKALEREGSFPADILDDALHKDSAEEVIQLLLEAGITLPGNFFSPSLGGRLTPALMHSLINHGWNVNSRHFMNRTPLMQAVVMEKYDCVKILIEAGADVNARDNDGFTPLMVAASRDGVGRKDSEVPGIIRLLLEHGADINATNNRGQCALGLIVQRAGAVGLGSKIFMGEILPMMLNAGADTSLLPLHEPELPSISDEEYEAFRSGWRDILREEHANDYRGFAGRLFREAVWKYDVETVKGLLEILPPEFFEAYEDMEDMFVLRTSDFPEADTEPSKEKSEIKRKLDAGSEILEALSKAGVNVPLLSPKGRKLTCIPAYPFAPRTTLEIPCDDFRELCMSYSPEALRRAISSGLSPNTGRGAGLNPLRVIAEDYLYYYDAAGMFDVLMNEGCNAGCLSSTWAGECLRKRGRLLMLRDIQQVKMMIQVFVHGKEDEAAGLRLKKPRTKERGRYYGWYERFGDLSCLNMLSHMWDLIEEHRDPSGRWFKFRQIMLLVCAGWGSVKDIEDALNHKADVNARTWLGYTPLMYASVFNSAEAVKFLIDNGADINARNRMNQNALTLAVTANFNRRDPKAVRVLAKAGADVNAVYDDGSAPLMLAAEHCWDSEVVAELIDVGADVSARRKDGKNALTLAVEAGKFRNVRTLLAGGARPGYAEINERPRTKACNKCGHIVSVDTHYCPSCGYVFPVSSLYSCSKEADTL